MTAHNAIDISGLRSGKLTALEKVDKDRDRRWRWRCRCDCGKEVIVGGREIRNKQTRSCGCSTGEFISKKRIIHGKARKGKNSGIYKSWSDAKQRCNNPNLARYPSYGGRGIKICERWHKFENFLEDMGSSWKPGLSIDRIDPDGDYEPGNCQWITRSENSKRAAAARRSRNEF